MATKGKLTTRPAAVTPDPAKVAAFVAAAPFHAVPMPALNPVPAEKPEKRVRVALKLPPELAERLKRAAWWDRTSVTALLEQGAVELLDRLEAERGAPYPPAGR